ncbi:MAG TPA: hypothetical protein VMG09_07195, partial [Bacteroidota bacterium]|nr:hypothetical protein [Bacteroidota bacterium]
MRTPRVSLQYTMVLLLAGFLPAVAFAQAPPTDFHFSATSGGNAPWSEMVRITIDSAGQASYVRSKSGGPPTILAKSTFTVGATGLQQLWQTIQDSGFFSLAATYSDTTINDGMFARMIVTANGMTHQVKIVNIAQPTIQGIIQTLNAVVPDSLQLPFSPPNQFNLVPQDPCSSTIGSVADPRVNALVQRSRDPKTREFPGPYPRSMNRLAQVDPAHPGTVVAYNVSLQYAIAHGWANLTSKGNFFGDAVSVTINNKNHPPPSDTITVTLFLEFWGPLATASTIDDICRDIASKWSGLTTSGGQTVQIGFVTRSDPYATSPPNTPGFNEIELVPNGSHRSDGEAKLNSGTGSGTWEVGLDPGAYGHEAGHLMGLPDRYTDFDKQPDGSWASSKTGQSFPNDDAFANYVQTKNPGLSLGDIKDFLKNNNLVSVPKDGSENDLMADVTKKPIQSDIDRIAAHPGLLVFVPSGTPLINRANYNQDLVVTHGDNVFVGPGATRTLNGIYAACVDHYLGSPSIGDVFDVAPPLSEWNGIRAAGYLARLLAYTDSTGLFCDYALGTQEAIWRISDNATPTGVPEIDTLFSAAGINIAGQILDFPRLDRNGSTDSASHPFIPNQLYVANISPAFSSGQIGVAGAFSAHVSHPTDSPPPVGLTWTAAGPHGSPASISGADSSASFSPNRSGVFQIGLAMVFNDSLHGQQSVTSGRNAYVIVPDAFTETFDHAGLTDKYPWRSSGDAPWTITTSYAETGPSSAQPGPVANGNTSTLGIDVLMPENDTISFSLRSLASFFSDELIFSIDSVQVDFFAEASDWTHWSEPVPAGKHRLTWTYQNFSSTSMNNVWIDNIFFPGNVV